MAWLTEVRRLAMARLNVNLSGWTWVRNARGRAGWVPSDIIEPVPAA